MRSFVRSTVASAVLCTLIVVFRSQFTPASSAAPPATPVEFSVDEIGNGLTLIGRLGKPLGTMTTVRGKWSVPDEGAKDDSPTFTISHVNDQPLNQPVKFSRAQVEVVTKNGQSVVPKPDDAWKQLNGKEWTIRAFETGSIEMFPEEYWKETGGIRQQPYWFKPFTSRLIGIYQR